MTSAGPSHFLIVTFPAQGHINPALQFATLLIRHGATVTYATAISALRRMGQPPSLDGLSFAWFSDGFDDGLKSFEDQKTYMSELKRRGTDALSDVIKASSGPPITCVVYSILVPWAASVAREFNLPTALLWIEPATVLDIYYYYFNGSYRHMFEAHTNNYYSSLISLPGLPPIAAGDLPSFLQPNKLIPSALITLREHIEALEAESNPKILVNTFSELEASALTAVEKFRMIPVGPLLFADCLSGGADLFQSSNDDYVKWLDSKPENSVVYISLGTHDGASPDKRTESLARGVLDSNRLFLWVMRAKKVAEENGVFDRLREELERSGRGIIVEWCSQTQVLSHPAIGCFVTHCGWNSILESLATGMPVVAFPQFADQCTSAKLVEDMWRNGVRVRENERGDVDSGDIRKCLDLVMDGRDTTEEMRGNAMKWKKLAAEAAAEDGPSDFNVKAFVEEIGREAWER